MTDLPRTAQQRAATGPPTPAELLERITTDPPRCGSLRVVAIDGGAASGKSTLACWLASRLTGAAVVHLDDLLDGWTGQFEYQERLLSQVLRPLAAGEPARYRRYDWTAGRFADWIELSAPQILLVEGVSAVTGCGGYCSTGLFLAVPRAERERRWIERDGPLQPEWRDWLDAEDRYFTQHPLPEGTVVLDSASWWLDSCAASTTDSPGTG